MHLEIGLWPCHNQGGNQVQIYDTLRIKTQKIKWKSHLVRF